jgi:hypothetical protein
MVRDIFQTSREQIDNRVRQAGELAKRFNNRLRTSLGNLAERYREGEVELDLRVCIHHDDHGVLVRARFWAPCGEAAKVSTSGTRSRPPSSLAQVLCDSNQIAMLTLIAEPMEGIQHVVPSLVRLECYDGGLVGGSEFLNFPPRTFIGKTRVRVADREFDARKFFGTIVHCERVDEMIKAVSLGLDDHARRCLDLIGDVPIVPQQLTVRKLWVGRNRLDVILDENSDLTIDDIDLAVRPIWLCARAGEIGFWHDKIRP